MNFRLILIGALFLLFSLYEWVDLSLSHTYRVEGTLASAEEDIEIIYGEDRFGRHNFFKETQYKIHFTLNEQPETFSYWAKEESRIFNYLANLQTGRKLVLDISNKTGKVWGITVGQETLIKPSQTKEEAQTFSVWLALLACIMIVGGVKAEAIKARFPSEPS